MSLKVWLPLDGDLRNLGTSNAIVANSSATINTTGKIGSCYSFAKNAYLDINKETMQNFSNAVSICFWIKINSWNTNWDTFFQAGKGSTAWTQYHIGILRNSANYLCWTLGNGSTASNANYRTGNITLGEWTHVACTYGEGKWATYLNGILSNSGTTTIVPNFSNITSIKIGGLAGNYKCDCLLNDFRIYDHCLSAAEVHEIAMGLVLHYKLDGNGFGNPNLLANSKLDGSWTYPSSSYSDKYSPITTSIPAASQYTLSFEAKSTVNGDKIRTHYYSPNTTTTCVSNQGVSKVASDGNMDFTLTTNWEKYWVIYSQNETTAVKHIICPRLVSGNGTGTVSVRNVKLEEGNIATPWCPNVNDDLYKILGMNDAIIEDSSGYGHNGTIVGTSTSDTSTPRYNNSLSMNNTGTSNHIETDAFTLPDVISVSFWTKANKSTNQVLFADPLNNIEFGFLNSLAYVKATNAVGWTTTNFINNEWNHIVVEKNGSTFYLYINGTLETQNGASNYYTHNGTKLWLLNRSANNNYAANASISDFRIYCTPLLDTDIKLLYNMGMRVDNLQHLHTFEYKENTSNLFRSELIMPWAKTGRTRIGEIVEHNNTYALNIAPEPFYKNIDSSTSGALNGSFAANTAYIFDMWIDTDSVIYNNNNVAGGMTIRYSDNSTDNTFVFTGGNKGYQHKVLITPSNKTIQRLEFYYYTSTDVFYRIDSCICPLSNLKLHKTGIFEGTNLLEETNTKLIKNALIETNEIIEL